MAQQQRIEFPRPAMSGGRSSFSWSGLSVWLVSRLAMLFLVVGAALFLAANAVMQRQFDEFDISYRAAEARQVTSAIEADNQSLLAAVFDYAHWDRSFEFIENANPEFISENFTPETLKNVRVDAIGIQDNTGKLLFSLSIGSSGTLQPIGEETFKAIEPALLRPLGADGSIQVFSMSGRPAVLARSSVTNTEVTLPPNGSMFFLRWLDGPYQQRIQNSVRVQFALHDRKPTGEELVAARSKDEILSAERVADSELYVHVSGKTALAQQRTYAFALLLGACIALVLVSLASTYIVFRKGVLGRLKLFAAISDRRQATASQGLEGALWPVQGDDELDRLASSLNELHSQLQASRSAMQELAFSDSLTELPNRRLMQDQLRRACVVSARNGGHAAFLLLDLDNFKSLNDTFGHAAGDEFLVQVARRLKSVLRESDMVARFGGDEFTVLLEGLSPDRAVATRDVEAVLRKLTQVFAAPFGLSAGPHTSSASIGVTLFSGASSDVMELTRQADLAMYKAKQDGGQGWRFFDSEQQVAAAQRHELEQDLARALAQDQLFLEYQVKRDVRGSSTGAEVLLRWCHPARGMVSPAQFIPVAESTGLIVPIGTWVLRTACEQLALWAKNTGFAHLGLSVNVSAVQFHQIDFVQQVESVLAATGAPAHRLRLELTESLLVKNTEQVIEKMRALKETGVTFSLDDFGTGYSSLAYLKRLPLDELKIDRSFVRDLLTDENDMAIVKTILLLAETMSLEVVAEGVETPEQHAMLARYGCPGYQGFLYGRPVRIEDFEAALTGVGQEGPILRLSGM